MWHGAQRPATEAEEGPECGTGSGKKEIREIWSVGGTRDARRVVKVRRVRSRQESGGGGRFPTRAGQAQRVPPAHAHAARMRHSPVPPAFSLAVEGRCVSTGPTFRQESNVSCLSLCPQLVAEHEAGTQNAVE